MNIALLGLETLIGLVLWLTGIAVGLWAGRLLDARHQRRLRERQQTLLLMKELTRWTNDVSSDMNEFRELIEEFAQRLAVDADGDVLFSRLLVAHRKLETRLKAAESALEQQARELETHASEARTDALTRLHNRRSFDRSLQQALIDVRLEGRSAVVILIDIDHFKHLNDTRGHLAGDAVLQMLSQLLQRHAPAECVVARFGGEEFACILPGYELVQGAAFAEQLRQTVAAASFAFESVPLRLTISCGLAQALRSEDSTSVLRRCDEALYAAKASGRNAVYLHDGVSCVAVTPASASAPLPPEELQMVHDFQTICRELRGRLEQVASSAINPTCTPQR